MCISIIFMLVQSEGETP